MNLALAGTSGRAKRQSMQLQTLARGIEVIDLLSSEHEPLPAREIAERLNLNITTVYKILATLESYGCAWQDAATRRYGLGMTVMRWAQSLDRADRVKQIARPFLQRLAVECGETVFLMVPRGAVGLYIDTVESAQTIRMSACIGKAEPMHCSSVGKAILAHLSSDEVDSILKASPLERFTAKTITDRGKFRIHIGSVRRQGYALDDEEGEEGVRCVGAPIFGPSGAPLAAMSIAAPAFRTPVERLHAFARPLITATQAVTEALRNGSDDPVRE